MNTIATFTHQSWNKGKLEAQRPVQFEITEQTRVALAVWIHQAQLRSDDCLFPSRLRGSERLSTR
ncbi:Phage integrase family protein [Pseudomonas chlororaphis subsp. piscium]|nr:Phage integrase family protein [Pseudomonas chlororaphis subsp. piscium]